MADKKFVVEYVLDYVHRVQVGVTADSEDAALKIVQEKFEEGSVWDNTTEVPVLLDDMEETDGRPLEFRVVESGKDAFPEPDASVIGAAQAAAATRAARLLVRAYQNGESNNGQMDWSDVDEAHAAAVAALGGVESRPVPCQNGKDRHPARAANVEGTDGGAIELESLGLTLSDGAVTSVAHIAAQLAAAIPAESRGKIGPFMQKWVATEAELSALNLKEINEPSWGASDETRRAELEKRFGASLKELAGKAGIKGLRIEFPGEPRGPAIHVHSDGAFLSNSFQGGLVVIL